MTRSGFVFFSLPDDYDELDDVEDEDFVHHPLQKPKPKPRAKPKPKTPTVKKSKKPKSDKSQKKDKKGKKHKKKKETEPSQRHQALLVKQTEIQRELIASLERENNRLRMKDQEPMPTPNKTQPQPQPQPQPQILEDHWSQLLEDERKCIALYHMGSQELYQIAGLLEPCILGNTSVVSHSVRTTDQLLMVMDYVRGCTTKTISETMQLPRNFVITVIEKYMETTAETFFSDTIRTLPDLTSRRLFLVYYKVHVRDAPMGGLYLMIDLDSRKIRRYKLLPKLTEPRNLEWNHYQGLRIELNHEKGKEVLDRMRFYFPAMKHVIFQSFESATNFYIFISALWNMMTV